MKRMFYAFIPVVVLACNNQTEQTSVAVNPEPVVQTEAPKAEPAPEQKPDSTLRDITNFTNKYGIPYIDSISALYSNHSAVKTTLTKNICKADSCLSIKTMVNPSSGITLHLIKGDNGATGFYNKQYILIQDAITMMHELIIAKNPTQPGWICKEAIWYFDKSQSRAVIKNDMVNEFKDIDPSLRHVPFETEFYFETAIYQRKLKELNFLLSKRGKKK
jgi:hypothetical protein